MTRKYLYYLLLTFATRNTSGIDKILVPKLSQTIHKLVTSRPPEEFKKNILDSRYGNLESAMQSIITYIWPGNESNAQIYNYIKKK